MVSGTFPICGARHLRARAAGRLTLRVLRIRIKGAQTKTQPARLRTPVSAPLSSELRVSSSSTNIEPQEPMPTPLLCRSYRGAIPARAGAEAATPGGPWAPLLELRASPRVRDGVVFVLWRPQGLTGYGSRTRPPSCTSVRDRGWLRALRVHSPARAPLASSRMHHLGHFMYVHIGLIIMLESECHFGRTHLVISCRRRVVVLI